MNEKKLLTWLKYLLHVVILAGVVIAAVRYLNGAEVLAALQRFDYRYAPFVLLLSALYLALKGWRFIELMRPMTQLAKNTLFRGYVAGQAATLVPGGVAARAGLMKQAGVPVSKSFAPVAYSSILDQVVFIGSSFVAALFFAAARPAALVLFIIIGVLAVLFAIPLTRSYLARAADWGARKVNAGKQWHALLDNIRQVSTVRILAVTLGITVLAFALKIVALDLTLRGLTFQLSYPKLFLIYILPTMLGRLSGLPAGIGVTEAGMVGLITNLSDVDSDTATAAVALFRVATIVFQAVLGAIFYAFFWHGENENPSANSTGAKNSETRKTRKRSTPSNASSSSQTSPAPDAARGEGAGH